MSHTLVFSAKPGTYTTILIYENMPIVDLAVNKFINSIIRQKKIESRMQFKDGKYFYTPSEEYILRVKSFKK